MDELEARVRCLELAAQLNKPTGDYSADGVVKTAMVLYTFAQASMPEETPVPTADKPKQRKPVAKHPDILS